jgi:hypothetical protein
MLKIASALVVGLVGYLAIGFVPPETSRAVHNLVARNWEIQVAHFHSLGR